MPNAFVLECLEIHASYLEHVFDVHCNMGLIFDVLAIILITD